MVDITRVVAVAPISIEAAPSGIIEDQNVISKIIIRGVIIISIIQETIIFAMQIYANIFISYPTSRCKSITVSTTASPSSELISH